LGLSLISFFALDIALMPYLPLFEITRVLVRLEYVASRIVHTNQFVIAVWRAKGAESAA
jgi:hypothetical protein